MKHFILTLALTSMFVAANAQSRKQDSSKVVPNSEAFRTDSVRNGQEVIRGKKSNPDTLSKGASHHKPKNNSAKNSQNGQDGTSPSQKPGSKKTATVDPKP